MRSDRLAILQFFGPAIMQFRGPMIWCFGAFVKLSKHVWGKEESAKEDGAVSFLPLPAGCFHGTDYDGQLSLYGSGCFLDLPFIHFE